MLCATDGSGALAVLGTQPADVLLLDYFMPGLTGEEVVTELRKTNRRIQVVLQTGYATERPPREMLKRLDIQGYHDKSDGPDKLLLWADAALKQAAALQEVHKNRQALALHPRGDARAPPDAAAGRAPAVRARPRDRPDRRDRCVPRRPPRRARCCGRRSSRTASWRWSAATPTSSSRPGPAGSPRARSLTPSCRPTRSRDCSTSIRQGESVSTGRSTIVPLRAGETTLGTIYLDQPMATSQDLELVRILANQAAVAIQNIRLYEMAALDPLTGVHARRFFETWIQKELHAAFRGPGDDHRS